MSKFYAIAVTYENGSEKSRIVENKQTATEWLSALKPRLHDDIRMVVVSDGDQRVLFAGKGSGYVPGKRLLQIRCTECGRWVPQELGTDHLCGWCRNFKDEAQFQTPHPIPAVGVPEPQG